MTSATVRSEALSERARELIPGGVSSSLRGLDPPLVFTRAKGSRVWDADGREYVDFHAGFGPTILGHADDRVRERVMETAREIDIVGAGSTELEIALAEKLREHVPSAERVLFTGSGSEATYHAIRVARAATGRPIVVKFQGGYHGWHDYTGANVISRADLVGSIDPISAGILPQALELRTNRLQCGPGLLRVFVGLGCGAGAPGRRVGHRRLLRFRRRVGGHDRRATRRLPPPA
jgi:glutamate-1-semialdehyde 2,1-aminomutase